MKDKTARLILLEEIRSMNVKLVVVSKTRSVAEIQELYLTGHKIFGENIVQELVPKYEVLPKDIEWHMIGHLQTNKVKYIAPFIRMIQSVDSLKLLRVINREAEKNNRIIDCLLQVHIAQEESKYGIQIPDLDIFIQSSITQRFPNIRICGLMGIATMTDNSLIIRKEFRELKQWFDKIKIKYFSKDSSFCELSMGMSNDYKIALEEGSTMVRIGSRIFGARH